VSDNRLSDLKSWIASIGSVPSFEIAPLAGDASFRRYFRLSAPNQSWVVMDAPPGKEDIQPFVIVAKAFSEINVQVPHIYAYDLKQGFILLSDLGDKLYLNLLNESNVDELYTQALQVLPHIQTCSREIENWQLPIFGEQLIRYETNLFLDWFLAKHLNMTVTTELSKLVENVFSVLLQSATEQPQVCVHRDYHSRNLLLLEDNQVGVLDFQDAVWGPITYDAVSLLRDCYVAWPRQQIENWALSFYDMLDTKKFSREQYLRWFDLMGMQRHIKVLGIFSRLCYRDQKPGYINDFPRILNYLLSVSERYPEFSQFHQFLKHTIAPSILEGVT